MVTSKETISKEIQPLRLETELSDGIDPPQQQLKTESDVLINQKNVLE